MKALLIFTAIIGSFVTWAQQPPVNCSLAVPGCSTPQFGISTNNTGNIVDFTAGSISNPSSNPQGVNSGCLLSGETTSTFITINIVSNGTLEWSIIGLNAGGTPSGSGCFDWIMWQDPAGSGVGGACAGINGNSLPPVACNWNGMCNGNTGMSSPANYPPAASSSSYQPPLTVTAGQSFILCLSNYSSTNQNVNLNFFGSAQVVCGVSAPDQTICQGNSASVTIATPGYSNPSFQWLNTQGVSNPTGGTNVTVTPTVTTTYSVKVSQPAVGGQNALTDTATFTITVVPVPTPNAGFGSPASDTTICLGTTLTLHGVPSSATNTSNWQVLVPSTTPAATAGFSPNASSMNPNTTPSQPGVYKYILRETNATCGTRRDTLLVTVSQLAITALGTNPLCPGASDGSIAINAPGANQFSYNNGATWVTNSSATGYAAGTYNVCAKNPQGCQKCTTATLTDPPAVTITASADTTVCQNGTATLTASATGGTSFTYTWDQTTDQGATQAFNPTATTTYNVYAQNQNGCASPTEPIVVTVRDAISATIDPVQMVCPGYPGTLSVNYTTGGLGAPYTFVWSTGETDQGQSGSITESPSQNTTYTVTITDGCESTPLVLTSQINVLPVPEPSFAAVDATLCEPAEFEVINTSTNSATAYWRVSDGQEFFNTDTLKPSALSDGSYAVTLIVTSADGCIDSVTIDNFLLSYPLPDPDFRWAPDPVQMFNTEVRFTNYSHGAISYEWVFEDAVPAVSNQEDPMVKFPDGVAATYDVMLVATTEFGCRDTLHKNLIVLPEVLLFAPNAFTPDGDEFNQTWRVFLEGVDIYSFELLVFNRWGEIVFESKDIEAAWDGTYHGKVMPTGVYKWTIRAKDSLNDGKYEWSGDINLIR